VLSYLADLECRLALFESAEWVSTTCCIYMHFLAAHLLSPEPLAQLYGQQQRRHRSHCTAFVPFTGAFLLSYHSLRRRDNTRTPQARASHLLLTLRDRSSPFFLFFFFLGGEGTYSGIQVCAAFFCFQSFLAPFLLMPGGDGKRGYTCVCARGLARMLSTSRPFLRY
jgi:hypothetical protein